MSLTEGVPPRARERLTAHFGPDVSNWLTHVASLVGEAAQRWDVRVSGFHDAGWTSVIALGNRSDGQHVVLKATPDRARFLRERTALRHWQRAPAVDLLAADDERQILLIRAVGGAAGGRPRPADHEARVASVLYQLHEELPPYGLRVPLLADYYATEVVPRVERRARTLDHRVPSTVVRSIVELCAKLAAADVPPALLHSDLYAENIPFDDEGCPVFIDPLVNIGDPAFDWAFWSVYYQSEGIERRLAMCAEHAPCPMDRIMQWAVTLVLDGALFYLETEDPRLGEMLRVLSSGVLKPAIGAV